MTNNFFGVLAEEYNEYDDFDEIMPYSEISTNGGNWRLLKCSPVAELIKFRFSKPRGVCGYNGKLTIYELNEMKEQIEKMRKSLEEDRVKMLPRLSQCDELIRKQRNLCSENCDQALQKHLDACTGDGTGNYKCTHNRVSYYCEYKDNGRCHHYYEIERLKEDYSENFEYYEQKCIERINELEYEYQYSLALKENRLREFLYDSDSDSNYWL